MGLIQSQRDFIKYNRESEMGCLPNKPWTADVPVRSARLEIIL
jgi:hypothetical protein